MGAINFITTILNMRAPGLTMNKMPLLVWSVLIFALYYYYSLSLSPYTCRSHYYATHR